MKLVKSLLLGSAAGLCAVAGAQAADLPVRKAAPVEYVRVCTAYGAGFFYIPGTDTCIRVGGRARFEHSYSSAKNAGDSQSSYRSLGRVSLDARTQTAYGTLRAFVRIDVASRTGGYLFSGTAQRIANAYPGLGQDTFGREQKFVELDKAYIQFAGITAGRAASFFDFYAHDVEIIGNSVGSDTASTNLLAYTMTFGGGLSATLSLEDPTFRRQPTYSPSGFNPFTGAGGVTPIATRVDPLTGLPIQVVNLDVRQTNMMPDIIGAVRYEAPWGVAQISAVVREIRVGQFVNGAPTATDFGSKRFANPGTAGVATYAGSAVRLNRPDAEYGYAVQGGLKFNLPQVAPGDVLWLQAAYAKGGFNYTGFGGPLGSYGNTASVSGDIFGNNNAFGAYDMAIDSYGRTHLTESWSIVAGYLHYWTPELRSGIFGTYGEVIFDKSLRGAASPLTAATAGGASSTTSYYPFLLNGISNATTTSFSGFGKDYSVFYGGANLIWSPVRDLDIGVEAIYQRAEFKSGKVLDSNKGVVLSNGLPTAVKSFDDQVVTRLRIQRDF